MGNKEGSANAKHPKTLTKKDYDFLINVSGLEKTEIDAVFNDFITEFPDGKLDRNQFCRLSNKLGSVPADLDQISTYIFRAFDSDHNGSISFNEFIISYALFSPRGDSTTKLNFAFDGYDIFPCMVYINSYIKIYKDGNGYLEQNEIQTVLLGLFDMLRVNNKSNSDLSALISKISMKLDSSNDGRVSKDEFIKGLLAEPSLKELLIFF